MVVRGGTDEVDYSTGFRLALLLDSDRYGCGYLHLLSIEWYSPLYHILHHTDTRAHHVVSRLLSCHVRLETTTMRYLKQWFWATAISATLVGGIVYIVVDDTVRSLFRKDA